MSSAHGTPRHSVRWTQILNRIAAMLHGAGDRLAGEDDARARLNGWQIQVRRSGLSRSYRDPRFAQLAGGPAGRNTSTARQEDATDVHYATAPAPVGEPPSWGGGRAQ